MRVIVTGDRNWYCPDLADRIIAGLVAKHADEVVIMEGGAGGVDRAFAEATDRHPVGHESYPVSPDDWRRLGKRAGPLRNGHMIMLGADLCIAVHPNILESKGTKDCVLQAAAAGIPVVLVQGDGKPKRLTPDHLAAIRGDWEPPEEDEPTVHAAEESESEGEALARLVDKYDIPPGSTGMICERGKGCRPIHFTIAEAPGGAPGNVAGVVQRAMRGEPTEEDKLDDKGKPPLIDGPPQFGQPRVSFWSHALGKIGQYNGRFTGDHPGEPEPIQWEEVLIHLAWMAQNSRLHAREITDETIPYKSWVETLANVHRFAKGGAAFLEDQLTLYLESALVRAEERLVAAPAEPPAPEPAPARHAGRKPFGSRKEAEAKLARAAARKPRPKRGEKK